MTPTLLGMDPGQLLLALGWIVASIGVASLMLKRRRK